MARINTVLVSVAVLVSLFFLSEAVTLDNLQITAIDSIDASPSDASAVVAISEEEEPVKTEEQVVFRDSNFIGHSFRIPLHRHGRPRCPHVHRGELGPNEEEMDAHQDEKKEFDEDDFEHKMMKMMKKMRKARDNKYDDEKMEEFEHKMKKKMKKMREERENKDDEEDDEKMEEFEHKRKKMMKRMRVNEGEAGDFEHENKESKEEDEDDDDKEEGWKKKFAYKRMKRFRKEREEGGGFMDHVHHFFKDLL